jgi:4-aminobutyrate aminotransferase-like enzyme
MASRANLVHHVGRRRPRLIAALESRLDELRFALRRFTNEPTVAGAEKLTAIPLAGLTKVLRGSTGPRGHGGTVAAEAGRAASAREISGTPER